MKLLSKLIVSKRSCSSEYTMSFGLPVPETYSLPIFSCSVLQFLRRCAYVIVLQEVEKWPLGVHERCWEKHKAISLLSYHLQQLIYNWYLTMNILTRAHTHAQTHTGSQVCVPGIVHCTVCLKGSSQPSTGCQWRWTWPSDNLHIDFRDITTVQLYISLTWLYVYNVIHILNIVRMIGVTAGCL